MRTRVNTTKPEGMSECLETQRHNLRKKYSEIIYSTCLENLWHASKHLHRQKTIPLALLLSISVGQASRNQPETAAREIKKVRDVVSPPPLLWTGGRCSSTLFIISCQFWLDKAQKGSGDSAEGIQLAKVHPGSEPKGILRLPLTSPPTALVENMLSPQMTQKPQPSVSAQFLHDQDLKQALANSGLTICFCTAWELESFFFPAELFQILKDDAVQVLHSICQQIWKTQQWPQDWKGFIFIPIPKKGDAREHSNYRICTHLTCY